MKTPRTFIPVSLALSFLAASCNSSYHAYISNKTGEEVTVTYRPYALDTSIAKKDEPVSRRPDSVFYLLRDPGVYYTGEDGQLKLAGSEHFPDVVEVELKPGQLLHIGDLCTCVDWAVVMKKTELSIIRHNESTVIKNPRTDFIRKRKVGIIYEIK